MDINLTTLFTKDRMIILPQAYPIIKMQLSTCCNKSWIYKLISTYYKCEEEFEHLLFLQPIQRQRFETKVLACKNWRHRVKCKYIKQCFRRSKCIHVPRYPDISTYTYK